MIGQAEDYVKGLCKGHHARLLHSREGPTSRQLDKAMSVQIAFIDPFSKPSQAVSVVQLMLEFYQVYRCNNEVWHSKNTLTEAYHDPVHVRVQPPSAPSPG